jgi:hypothetical protein
MMIDAVYDKEVAELAALRRLADFGQVQLVSFRCAEIAG